MNNSIKTKLLFLVSAVCFIFIFVGGPDYYSARSYKNAWDLGHVVFFATWTYLLLISWKKISTKHFIWQCFWIFSIALSFGVVTEVAQSWFGRTTSKGDLIMDLTGSAIALVFFSVSRKTLSRKNLLIMQFSVLMIILIEITPLAIALTDETIARKQFPVLSDFEIPFEENRWVAQTRIVRDNCIADSGKFSLKVPLNTAKYSGVGLKYFHGDWRGYKHLEFSVFNSFTNDLEIHCRVHDQTHILTSQEYTDRFNSTFLLAHGWNDIKIDFDQIINAPVGRKMDMANVKGLGFFAVSLPKPGVIYIDNVRLTR